MAKYNINYSCGHSGQIALVGKGKDRERKIEWLEKEGLCLECYKKQKREEEKARGVVMEIRPAYEGKLTVAITGDTYPIKDTLKAAGYRFEEIDDISFNSYFSLKAPLKAWNRIVETPEQILELYESLREQIPNLTIENRVSELDIALAKDLKKWQTAKKVN